MDHFCSDMDHTRPYMFIYGWHLIIYEPIWVLNGMRNLRKSRAEIIKISARKYPMFSHSHIWSIYDHKCTKYAYT